MLTVDEATATNTINAEQMCIVKSDIDELVGDCKVHEFMQYIGHIDSDALTHDKLSFREFSDESKRLRYPSFNTGSDVDDEIDEFTLIVAPDGNETEEEVASRHEDETDEGTIGRHENDAPKRFENKRKTNMFANDTARFIEYERLNESKQMQSASATNVPQLEHIPRESLTKSKTVDQFLSSAASKANGNSPEIIIESPSIAREESSVSDASGESSYFNFKRSSESEEVYLREDSWLSNESNVLSDRSQSSFSELEYIHGRDDWKNRPNATYIPAEIDSDDYHHRRRFSENSDTLEYIRGREDWLKNEMDSVRSCTLPRIFEHGDRKFLIQDEIDSDEYHHAFYVQEAVRTATELGPRFLVHGSARNGRARSPYKVLHAEINKNEFLQRYYWHGGDQVPTDESGFESMPSERGDVAEENMIRNERLIWIQNENSRSQSPLAVEVNAIKATETQSAPVTASIDAQHLSNEFEVEYEQEIRSEEINEVIDNIIDARILTKDSLEKSPSEDIEIMVLDLAETKPKRGKQFNEPFIVISEAADDEAESSTIDDATQICESDTHDVMQLESSPSAEPKNDDDVDMESFKFVNAPNEIDEKQQTANGGSQPQQSDTTKNAVIDTATAAATVTMSPMERSDTNLTKINEKSTQNKKIDLLDDLIKEGSLGLWFHK